MMKYGILLALALCSACGTTVTQEPPRDYPPAPIVPELPKTLEEACPALKPIPEGSVKALVEAAAGDAIVYADCKKKFLEVLELYKRVKKEQDSHTKQLELFKHKQ